MTPGREGDVSSCEPAEEVETSKQGRGIVTWNTTSKRFLDMRRPVKVSAIIKNALMHDGNLILDIKAQRAKRCSVIATYNHHL